MAQVSLYLEDSFFAQIEQIAQAEKIPISNWIVNQLRPKISNDYSKEFTDLFGSLDDPTFTRPKQLNVEQREEF